MAYGDFKDLLRRTGSYNVLCNKAFNISKNPKYGGHQRPLVSVVYGFFDKKSSGGLLKVKLCKINNYLKNWRSKLLENITNAKYTHVLKAIIGVLIQQICN